MVAAMCFPRGILRDRAHPAGYLSNIGKVPMRMFAGHAQVHKLPSLLPRCGALKDRAEGLVVNRVHGLAQLGNVALGMAGRPSAPRAYAPAAKTVETASHHFFPIRLHFCGGGWP